MKVQQLSVFLENASGRLAAVSRALGEAGINIRALSLADTEDYGILRLIVTDPERACRQLKDAGFTVSVTNVIAVQVPDEPGGLARVMAIMDTAGVNIEYLYAFCGKRSDHALVIFRVEEPDSAIRALQSQGIAVLPGEQICGI